MQLGELNSSVFYDSKLKAAESKILPFAQKIASKKKLNPIEKVELGKVLESAERVTFFKVVYKVVGFFNKPMADAICKFRADYYLKLLRKKWGVGHSSQIKGIHHFGAFSLKSEQAGQSSASKLELLQGMLNLRWAEDTSQLALLKEKQIFMANALGNADWAPYLFKQAKTHPEMLQGIVDLRETYAKWEIGCTTELKQTILQKHQNLIKLSVKLASAPAVQTAEKPQKPFPITPLSLAKEAELFANVRKGQAYALMQPQLKGLGTSENHVYKLFDPSKPNKVVAYYKEGLKDNSVAFMEKLVWDIAVLLGLEANFAATKRTEIYSGDQAQGGTRKVNVWAPNGELYTLTQAQKIKKGGIQTAQNGVHLHGAVKKVLTKEEVGTSLVRAVILGMSDAHNNNMLFDKLGRCLFFDNTQCLHPSNNFINRLGRLETPFRCSLLRLPVCFKLLTPKEKKKLLEQLEETEQKMLLVKAYLNDPLVKKRLDKLPEGWLDTPKAVACAEERIANMKKALHSPGCTLRDLALAAYPQLKLMVVMHLCAENPGLLARAEYDRAWRIHLQQKGFKNIGDTCFSGDVKNCAQNGWDPKYVQALCQKYPIHKVLKKLVKRPSSTPEIREKNAHALIQECKAIAEVDLKETEPTAAKAFLYYHKQSTAA